jgi:hypothetical protein
VCVCVCVCLFVFSSFCGKRLLLTINDICDGILELKNMLGCGGGLICSYVNSHDLNSNALFFCIAQPNV